MGLVAVGELEEGNLLRKVDSGVHIGRTAEVGSSRHPVDFRNHDKI